MDTIEGTTISKLEELATIYDRPAERVLKKEVDHVDALGRAFIAASPFLVLRHQRPHGLDCSPKGDRPGFVQVEDDGKTLLIPDRRGNNRIDGLKNLVEDPRVALIFFVAGRERDVPRQRPGADQRRSRPQRRFVVNGKEPEACSSLPSSRRSSIARRRSCAPIYGSGARAAGRKACPTLGDFAVARQPDIDSAAYDTDYAKRMPNELY